MTQYTSVGESILCLLWRRNIDFYSQCNKVVCVGVAVYYDFWLTFWAIIWNHCSGKLNC